MYDRILPGISLSPAPDFPKNLEIQVDPPIRRSPQKKKQFFLSQLPCRRTPFPMCDIVTAVDSFNCSKLRNFSITHATHYVNYPPLKVFVCDKLENMSGNIFNLANLSVL